MFGFNVIIVEYFHDNKNVSSGRICFIWIFPLDKDKHFNHVERYNLGFLDIGTHHKIWRLFWWLIKIGRHIYHNCMVFPDHLRMYTKYTLFLKEVNKKHELEHLFCIQFHKIFFYKTQPIGNSIIHVVFFLFIFYAHTFINTSPHSSIYIWNGRHCW